jgi:class 3 adenylate cyclase
MNADPSPTAPEPKLEMASVLFMDIVGYSKLPMDQGARLVEQLTRMVEATEAVQRAKKSDQLVLLPTGDGMALAFFGDPIAPVQCAADISRELRTGSEIQLRMGVHAGPVYHTVDINEARNVAGGGINLAQRVMDCGDEGHILLSQSVADVLFQLSEWREYVHDLGVMEVKHGERVHVFNLYSSDFGNSEPPKKAQAGPTPAEGIQKTPVTKWALVALAAVVVLVAALNWEALYCRVAANSPGCVVETAPLVERSFTYWITLQRPNRDRVYGDARRLPGEVVFNAYDRIFLHLASSQDGYLYIVTEGPELVDGLPSYVLQFPYPGAEAGASFLPAGQASMIPESGGFQFDEEEGTEKLWLVWAAEPKPALERVNPTELGEVTEPAEVRAVREFLATLSSSEPEVNQSDEEQYTVVKAPGEVLVHLVRLQHY